MQGERPDTPLRAFLCKVVSRCNLDCDYCYVYHRADQSWRRQPRLMSLATAAQVGRRINEHARGHGLTDVLVTLHGGEPLLASPRYLQSLCETIVNTVTDAKTHFSMQTNGTRFDERALEFCNDLGVRVGLSSDGPRTVNDRHRVDHRGASSFEAVDRAIKLLTSPAGRTVWSGFLAVIDIETDPVKIYSYFRSYSPPTIEFLMPLNHYEERPPGKEASLEHTPYADWLLRIFDVWYRERPQPIMVRRFRDIIALLLGASAANEEWGLAPVDFIVVETNGEIQAVDSLKVTYPGACDLGLDVFNNSFDDALLSASMVERQAGLDSLCRTCQECELVTVCGGGYYPHRYSRDNLFQNPSVYCSDLTTIIRSIRSTIENDLRIARTRSIIGADLATLPRR